MVTKTQTKRMMYFTLKMMHRPDIWLDKGQWMVGGDTPTMKGDAGNKGEGRLRGATGCGKTKE